MNYFKILSIIIFLLFFHIKNTLANEVDRKIFFLESLINQGDYEDAILEGQSQLKKYRKDEKVKGSIAIANALLSRAYYHWYHFQESDRYFKTSFDAFNELSLDSEEKLIAGLFLVETALQQNRFLDAVKIVDIMPKPSFKATNEQKTTYAILEARTKAAFGEYFSAIKILDSRVLAMSEKLSEEFSIAKTQLEIQKMIISIDYGNIKDADTLRKSIERRIKENSIKNNEFKFYLDLANANILYKRRFYYQAALAYLNAYHTLDGSEEEYRRFEALKMSAISSIKAGTVADYHKLFRRSDMLAFKKPIRSQAFRPGVMQLRLEELLETGQYELALSKANEYTSAYKFLPSNNPYFIEFLKLKAKAAESVGDINTFVSIVDTLEKVIKQNFTTNSLAYADIQLLKAELQTKYLGQFEKSSAKYGTYFEGYAKYRISSSSMDNMAYFNGQLKCFSILSKNDSTLLISKKALSSAIKAYGINSPEAVYFESNLALSQFNAGLYKEVKQTLTSLNARKVSSTDEENPFYLQSLFIQAQLYEWFGEYSKVKELINDANSISLQKSEPRFYEQTTVAEALGNSFLLNGNYLKADRNLKFSIETKLKKIGDNSFLLIEPYLQMIDLKIQKGELKEADKYLLLVDKLIQVYFPQGKSKFHIYYFYNKSKYYNSISDYRKSKEALLAAIDIAISIYGNSHIRLAPLYAELAKIVLNDNQLNATEAFNDFEIAKQIIENSIGKETPVYMKLIVQQALLMIESGKYDIAEKSLLEAEKYWILKLGNENQQVAEINLIRASLYYSLRKYADADKFYKKAASQFESVFNKRHTGYLSAQTGIAKVAYMFNQYQEAADIIEPVLEQRLKFVDNNFSVMSFGQKTGFWSSFKEEFELYNSIATKLVSSNSNMSKAAQMYNFALSTKGLLLNSDAKLRRQIFSSGDSTLIANFNEWQYQKEYYGLVSSYSKSQLDEEKIVLEKIEQNIEQLEKLIQSKAGVTLQSSSKKTTWLDVKRAIGNSSTAVEIVKFRYFNHTFTDSTIYASLLVDGSVKDAPRLVLLGNGKRMEGRSLNYYRNATINKQEDIYSYQVYFMPMKAHIPDGNTIYFAGEGVYTQLNPEMFFDGDQNKYALESNPFVFVTSTRDVITDLDKKNVSKSTSNLYYLYGNPNFYTNKILDKKTAISQLQGAEREVLEINEKLKSYGKETVNLIGKTVTEDTVKSTENAYILHIATHGYFMERKKTGSELVNNPMLNSGLLLANAGTLLQSPDLGYINQKQGVLTASEVMDLNFSKTKLVILSACETGRGQVEVGEGVYGLQRAFLMAGANAIILSLFKVDDEATRLLMLKFYDKFLTNGNDYRKAFREAKQELRNSKDFNSPVYWGAFIMIEGNKYAKSGT